MCVTFHTHVVRDNLHEHVCMWDDLHTVVVCDDFHTHVCECNFHWHTHTHVLT